MFIIVGFAVVEQYSLYIIIIFFRRSSNCFPETYRYYVWQADRSTRTSSDGTHSFINKMYRNSRRSKVADHCLKEIIIVITYTSLWTHLPIVENEFFSNTIRYNNNNDDNICIGIGIFYCRSCRSAGKLWRALTIYNIHIIAYIIPNASYTPCAYNFTHAYTSWS